MAAVGKSRINLKFRSETMVTIVRSKFVIDSKIYEDRLANLKRN